MVESYVHIMLALRNTVQYCISHKKIHQRDYYYKQITENGRRRQIYIPQSEVEEAVAAYEQKKALKQKKREMDQQIRQMSRAERKDFRERVRLYQASLEAVEQNLMPNGEGRDSKSEVIISQLLERLKVKYQYNVPIITSMTIRRADFEVKGLIWEHMGMLGNREYEQRQANKMEEYAQMGIVEGKNLLITKEHQYLSTPQILWKLVQCGIVTAHQVIREFY